MKVVALPSFERSIDALSSDEKKRVAQSLELFNTFLVHQSASHGFGLKKIGPEHYEFRAGLRLRVIVKAKQSVYYLVLAGDHNEIRKYLKKNL